MTTAAAGLVVAGEATAQAGTVTVTWGCGTIWGPAGFRTLALTVTAPATARVGETVTLRGSWVNAGSGYHPVPAAAGAYSGFIALKLGGAGSGRVEIQGLTNPAIAEGEQFRMEGGQAQITLPARGEVTFAPTGMVYRGPVLQLSCVGGPTPISATTRVS